MSINIHHHAQQYVEHLVASECSQPFMPNCDVYKVLGKIYLMAFILNEQRVLNIKIDPIQGEMLRDFYPFIHIGYHMNKKHWITIYEHDDLNIELLFDLIQSSYDLVTSKLSRLQKQQLALLQSTK